MYTVAANGRRIYSQQAWSQRKESNSVKDFFVKVKSLQDVLDFEAIVQCSSSGIIFIKDNLVYVQAVVDKNGQLCQTIIGGKKEAVEETCLDVAVREFIEETRESEDETTERIRKDLFVEEVPNILYQGETFLVWMRDSKYALFVSDCSGVDGLDRLLRPGRSLMGLINWMPPKSTIKMDYMLSEYFKTVHKKIWHQ